MVEASRRGDFWSRRRAAVEAEAAAEAAARRAAEAAEARAALEREQAEKTDAELLADLDLKDPDTMGEGDDFAAFMRASVPDHLRRRALRRLWRTNPVLANLDGLVDHGEDFSDAATVLPDMKTAYQVGRGMSRHVVALAEAAAADAESAALPDATPVAAEDEAEPEALSASSPRSGQGSGPGSGTGSDSGAEEAVAVPDDTALWPSVTPIPRRHMRFAFGDKTEGAPA